MATSSAQFSSPQLIPCPVCKTPTNSLKRYTLVQLLVFVGIAYWMRRATHTACPDCMRSVLVKNIFSINILSANILWLLILLPYDLVLMAICGKEGHSNNITKLLEEARNKAETR